MVKTYTKEYLKSVSNRLFIRTSVINAYLSSNVYIIQNSHLYENAKLYTLFQKSPID